MGCEEFEQIVDFEPNAEEFEEPNPFDRIRRAATAPFILFFHFCNVCKYINFTFPFGCECMQSVQTGTMEHAWNQFIYL